MKQYPIEKYCDNKVSNFENIFGNRYNYFKFITQFQDYLNTNGKLVRPNEIINYFSYMKFKSRIIEKPLKLIIQIDEKKDICQLIYEDLKERISIGIYLIVKRMNIFWRIFQKEKVIYKSLIGD